MLRALPTAQDILSGWRVAHHAGSDDDHLYRIADGGLGFQAYPRAQAVADWFTLNRDGF